MPGRKVAEVDQSFSLFIKHLRMSNNLRQKDISEGLGIQLSTYQFKEAGQRKWCLAELFLLGQIFGMSTVDLFNFFNNWSSSHYLKNKNMSV